MLTARFVAVLLAIAYAAPSFAQQLPLTMSKSFTPSTVQVGGTQTTTMSVTITNPNPVTVTGINFSDTYPAGLVPDVVGSYTCGPGSALFNGSGWAFSGVTLAAGASCSVPMLMHATITGSIVNTTSSVTGTGVPTGGPASATLTVNAAAVNVVALPFSPEVLLALAAMLALLAVVRVRAYENRDRRS